jgi:hypothetical protein
MRIIACKTIYLAGVCCLLLSSLPARAQTDAAAAQDHLRAATQAYRDGDFEGFTTGLEQAVARNAFSLYTRYNLACAYVRSGRDAEALKILRQLVGQRIDFGMAEDPDLESLRDNPDFVRMVEELEQRVQPILVSKHRFTLDELGLIPEGIAHDAQTGRIFLGSMRTGEIFVIDNTGQLSKFATVSSEGNLAAIGMSIERSTNTLWVVGSSFFLAEQFDADAPARSGIFGFDLDSGELTGTYMAEDMATTFNDVVVGATGDLYISGDDLSVVRNGSDKIEVIATSSPVFGSNGIAVHPDGKRIFVSSYPVGIAAVDPATGDSFWLDAPDDVSLYGIDGLYWYEGDLVAIQNGVRPWRLLRLQLDDKETAVTGVRLIEFANTDLTGTTGAIDGNLFHFVGRDPQPESIPTHFSEALQGMAGKTIVMTVPLD